MKKTIKYMLMATMVVAMATFQSCSLEEENPGGFTMETMSLTVDGYETLINQCYFAMERYLYATDSWMHYTDAESDLWTYQANLSTNTQWFWFYAGAAPNTTYTNSLWNGLYDGIGSCNMAISLSGNPPYDTEAERNAKIAEARFLRAVYYFNGVEQFGGMTMITEPVSEIDYSPKRTDPLTIYKEVIIPDLEFAAEWLSVGDDKTTTQPTKKAALGMLAKACLQSTYWDDTDQYAADALKYAKMLIDDCEAGGGTYNTYMYSTYDEVFNEDNNFTNKEALWKHRWYAGDNGHGSSNGNYKLNRNNEYFGCNVYNFGAFSKTQAYITTYDGMVSGQFMPTQHLINLFVQDDGTLDPRFHKTFRTEWKGMQSYTWDSGNASKYDKSTSVVGTALAVNDLAIKFLMPQDAGYETELANRYTSPYLVIDYNDVYNDTKKNINMTYAYHNTTSTYLSNGSNENLFKYFYPALTKHNSSHYYVANASKMRNGNLNAFFIMRMAEVYLIAAEADIYVNGGANAMAYINKVRVRAGATPLTGTATIRTVLDERGRELCGEGCRFYDLKRTGMFADATYLTETHPDLAQYFDPNYALRPISTTYTATLTEGVDYQNPGY
jgi:starch-binding outer membrane protein, SusD/RagB family